MTQAAAAAIGEDAASATEPRQAERSAKAERHAIALEKRLERKLAVAQKYRSVVRFFENHRSLLSSMDHRVTARTALRRAARRLRAVTKTAAAIRRVLRRQEAHRRANASPRAAICAAFGRRYCGQALAVAWCESRHSTAAQNGQYVGLFQMGSSERRRFGHGPTARQQALAAHRYFVVSGRDWSPWSCKPRYAY